MNFSPLLLLIVMLLSTAFPITVQIDASNDNNKKNQQFNYMSESDGDQEYQFAKHPLFSLCDYLMELPQKAVVDIFYITELDFMMQVDKPTCKQLQDTGYCEPFITIADCMGDIIYKTQIYCQQEDTTQCQIIFLEAVSDSYYEY
eukprot:TRINITY_DN20153_c0_g1_i1.p1 TRINITY_DN20153_c0_g1~~TRINITY_DN20153_c0_g1_i1.p1  ORF type:complete len:145 (-),score=7.33 TRINITY_DN20153_c0_g1_i1:194-628(-)